MYVVRIEIAFEAAHRLLGHPGKCAQPHGHSYRAEVLAGRAELDEIGLAIDFGDLKRELKAWVDEHWDHAFLVNDRDEVLVQALRQVPECKLYCFDGANPSAEAMARELYNQAWRRFGDAVLSTRIWESPTSYAEFRTGGGMASLEQTLSAEAGA